MKAPRYKCIFCHETRMPRMVEDVDGPFVKADDMTLLHNFFTSVVEDAVKLSESASAKLKRYSLYVTLYAVSVTAYIIWG